jgi:hypothetical protein
MRKAGAGTLLLAVLLTACGDPPALSPAEVVSKAATATAGISSMHFVVDTNKLQTYPPGLFLTRAEGDVVRPDKLQARATVLIGAGTQHFAAEIQAVSLGNEQFMTDPASGKWGPMPTSMNVLAAFDPNKGIGAILSHATSATSDGTETVDGVSCYRLTTTLAPGDLRDLSSEVDAKAGPVPTRLWIASSDFLLRRVELKGALLLGDPADVVRTINFTKYNATVEISRPPVTTTATTPTP